MGDDDVSGTTPEKRVSDLAVKAAGYRYEATQRRPLQFQLFNRMDKIVTVMRETLNFYGAFGSEPLKAKDIGAQERIIAVQRMALIEAMSAIEYYLREYISENPDKIGKCASSDGEVYLFNILEKCKSKKVKLISCEEFNYWNGLRLFRNATVHNNGFHRVDEEYKKYDYAGEILELTPGKMMQASQHAIPSIINWLLDRMKELFSRLDPL